MNWDPVENTVLANEQVDADGRSWRSGAIVEQRELEQWFLHITEFKESLLRDLEKLGENDAWPERVLAMQKNWLGRSEGAYYQFPVSPASSKVQVEGFEIFTTRPETIFAAQFIAISPNSQLADDLSKNDPELRSFLSRAKTLPHDTTEGFQLSQVKAVSPLSLLGNATKDQHEPLPVYVAPYVRGDYETAAVMGVPAHDARDFAFWKRHRPDDPIKYAITSQKDETLPIGEASPVVVPGYMTSLAGEYQGKRSEDVAKGIVAQLHREKQLAKATVKWKLRDWLISRQRYWGTPIPIVHCDECGPQPVPDDQLPVKLPRVGYHWADGRTGNPLETATDWVETTCPKCHSPAKRDTDTMDTFMDSSWYYMRFPDPHNPTLPISEEAARQHLPVDIYVGGVEHAILHLLYARFVYKAVMGLLYPAQTDDIPREDTQQPDFRKTLATQSEHEPFQRLITQGMVHGKTYTDPDTGRFLRPDEVDLSDSSAPRVVSSSSSSSSGQPAAAAVVSFEKMSKSKHNGVDPGSFIAKYGADATRAHILFQAPVGDILNWDEDKIAGVTRWLRRVHDLTRSLAPSSSTPSSEGGRPENWDALQHFSKAAADPETTGGDGHGVVPQQKRKQKQKQRAIDTEVWRTLQNTIISVTRSMEKVYSLNTAVSDLMSLTNVLVRNAAAASRPLGLAATAQLLRMLAPIAPAVAEECWSVLYPAWSLSPSQQQQQQQQQQQEGHPGVSGMTSSWPVPDGTLPLLSPETIKCAVQVNGKLRCVVEIPARPPPHIDVVSVSGGGDGDVDGVWEFGRWVTGEILRSAEHQEGGGGTAARLLTSGATDIRRARKVFPVKGGRVVNYVM